MRPDAAITVPLATVATPSPSLSAEGLSEAKTPIKHKHRKAPKTRSGCITCKRRRVKCDELKPSCQRCSKAGYVCKGYATPKAWIFEPSSTLTGGADGNSDTESSASGSSPSVSNQVLSLITPYGSEQDTRSLAFFLKYTASTISNYSNPYFWNVFLPQASWSHPAIKHALVATSMIQEALPQLHGKPARPDHAAVVQYNKAIQVLIREPVCPPTEVVLLTCILFFTFDNFNGTTLTAQKHILSGIKVLEEWRKQSQVQHAASRNTADQIIQDYIVPIMTQALSYYKACMPTTEIQDVNVEEERGSTSTESTLTVYAPSEHVHDSSVTRHLNNLTFHKQPFRSFEEAVSSLAACTTLLRHSDIHPHAPRSTMTSLLQSWRKLLEHAASHVPSWPHERRMLMLHHRCLVLLAQLLDGKPSANHHSDIDQVNAGFRQIILELRNLLSSTAVQASPYFKCKLGLIAPLYIVGTQSANAVLRGEAISVLRTMQRQEDRWTAHTAADICEGFGMILNCDPVIACLARSRKGLLTAEVVVSRTGEDRQPQPWMRLVHHCSKTEKHPAGTRKESEWLSLSWSTNEVAAVDWPLDDLLQRHGYQLSLQSK